MAGISGALFVVTGTVHYSWEKEGATAPVLFAYAREDDANAMVAHLVNISNDEKNVATYNDIRVALCQFCEIPDNYNDTDPLV